MDDRTEDLMRLHQLEMQDRNEAVKSLNKDLEAMRKKLAEAQAAAAYADDLRAHNERLMARNSELLQKVSTLEKEQRRRNTDEKEAEVGRAVMLLASVLRGEVE